MKKKVADAIAPDTNPRAQVSVLADNGLMNVEFYYNDDEYTQKYDELLAQLEADKAILGEEITQEDLYNIDKSLIRMGIDENNMMNPILTDDQKKAVRDYISEQIDIRTEDKISRDIGLEYKIEMQNKKQTVAEQRLANAQAAAKARAASSGSKTSKTEAIDAATSQALRNIFNKKNSDAVTYFNGIAKQGYRIKLVSGSYRVEQEQDTGVLAKDEAGKYIDKKEWKKVDDFKTLGGLLAYLNTSTVKENIRLNLPVGELD
jgi:hypothetical protein